MKTNQNRKSSRLSPNSRFYRYFPRSLFCFRQFQAVKFRKKPKQAAADRLQEEERGVV